MFSFTENLEQRMELNNTYEPFQFLCICEISTGSLSNFIWHNIIWYLTWFFFCISGTITLNQQSYV